MNKLMPVLGMLALIVFLVAIGPIAFIWSWNQLFGTFHVIDYTFWNWLAAAIIMAVLAPNIKVTKNS